MKIHRVSVIQRPSFTPKWIALMFKGIFGILKALAPLLCMIVPMIFIVMLYVWGIPGLSISGEYACNYRDFLGTYGAPPYSNKCGVIKFRKVPIFPYVKER